MRKPAVLEYEKSQLGIYGGEWRAEVKREFLG